MKKTLSNRINSLIAIISIILASIFFLLILKLNSYSQKRELSQVNYFLDTLIAQKRELLANEIFSGQEEAIESTIGEFTANEGIMSGAVYSVSGEEISSVGEQYKHDALEDLDRFVSKPRFEMYSVDDKELAIYTSGINLGGETFGYIRLYYDISPIKEHSRNMTAIMLMLLAMKTIVLVLILNMRLNKIVVDPIKRLQHDMSSISNGNFEIEIAEFEILEIDQMKNAFNEMTYSLKQTQENLEKTVIKRTKELTESKNMLGIVIDTIPTPVFYKDKYGKYMECNSAFAELLDKSKDEIIGKSIFDLMEEKYAKPVFEKEREMLRNPKSESYEGKFKTVYGLKDVIVNKASIVSESGEVEGLVAVMSDITQMKKMEKQLKKLSVTDRLTQLYNRLKTDEVLEYELTKSLRSRNPFSIIIFDIDNFKEINDTYGHSFGDSVLVELSNILTDTLRSTDTLGRWGGEEFIIICPDTNIDGAITVAEKIRATIENNEFKEVGEVTCSFGVTEFKAGDTNSTIVARADTALYEAKKKGRNRVKFK